ncbi:MAG: hypothetical protein SCK29_06960 [Bacillota bacterium]|nr:hypothetical protein [Bacillota bacterium]MDW7683844.1 hypothetical protein [Bacillota bacterium]
MVRILYELDEHIDSLCSKLKENHGLQFKATVRNRFHHIEVLMTDTNYPYGKDWMPQMFFIIRLNENKVFLKYLRLPETLRHQGIGTLCFQWLIGLCRHYGIDEIEGGAVDSSKAFWSKLGVVHTTQKSRYLIQEKSAEKVTSET